MSRPGDTTLPTGLPPDPFSKALPSGGKAPVTNNDTRTSGPRRTAMNTMSSYVHKPTSEWTIRSKVRIAVWRKLDYHNKIENGDYLMKMLPGMRVPHITTRTAVDRVMNVQSFNDFMKRSWENIENRLKPLLQLAAENPDRLRQMDTDEGLRVLEFGKYLAKPESQWAPLFSEDSKLSHKTDPAALINFLCLQGIIRSYIPLGPCEIEPNPRFTDQGITIPGTRKYLAPGGEATWIPEGTYDMPNIVGEKASQNAYLFLVIKRHFDEQRGEYTHFAATFDTYMSKAYPSELAEYTGTSGGKQLGAVWLVGRINEILGRSAPLAMVPALQGVTAKLDESLALMRNYGKIRVLVISPKRII